MTTLYCLRFESPPNLEGQGDPVIPLGIGCRFRPFQVLSGLRWRYPNPPPQGERITELSLCFVPLERLGRNHRFQHYIYCWCSFVAVEMCMFANVTQQRLRYICCNRTSLAGNSLKFNYQPNNQTINSPHRNGRPVDSLEPTHV
jgi:hypothetical protein